MSLFHLALCGDDARVYIGRCRLVHFDRSFMEANFRYSLKVMYYIDNVLLMLIF